MMAFAFQHKIFDNNEELQELAEKFDADYQALPAVKAQHEITETTPAESPSH